ncbi:MAG: hypothetical protein G3M78_10650 [Candidatus Nitrohelix vancouverensis]|uniref:Uncharacterized protein n=1 Tax=Candidatus Nitrohelix vancouverensis TaxID=2705534 RepID=A0A7T0G3V6_9BACT|nr:MAG: hypothetical protein G3M78_10650 [Candidatus Nitrohelix vancouverensis]
MARKKNTGQRNFFRFMAFIGVVTIGTIGYGFLTAAPALSPIPEHQGSANAETCLSCHMTESENIPIMPHRPMSTCTFCHSDENLASATDELKTQSDETPEG